VNWYNSISSNVSDALSRIEDGITNFLFGDNSSHEHGSIVGDIDARSYDIKKLR
jgi:hypothetical protein